MGRNIAFDHSDRDHFAPDASSGFRIVVAGEFNSGKSSLINLLLRQQAVPPGVSYSHMPPLRIDLQAEEDAQPVPDITMLGRDGTRSSSEHLPKSAEKARELSQITMRAHCAGLAGASLIEVSAGEDGHLSAESEAELRAADLIIWCTMGQRAWCLSEMTIVDSLPPERLAGAVLAVTRADYLDEASREHVMDRVTRMAAQTFSRIVMVDAGRAALEGSASETGWAASGGQEIFQILQAALADPGQAEAPAHGPALVEDDDVAAALASDAAIHRAWCDEMEAIRALLLDTIRPGERAPHQVILQRLSHVVEQLPEPGPDGPQLAAIYRRAHGRLAGAARDGSEHALALDLAIQLQDRFAPRGP